MTSPGGHESQYVSAGSDHSSVSTSTCAGAHQRGLWGAGARSVCWGSVDFKARADSERVGCAMCFSWGSGKFHHSHPAIQRVSANEPRIPRVKWTISTDQPLGSRAVILSRSGCYLLDLPVYSPVVLRRPDLSKRGQTIAGSALCVGTSTAAAWC